MILSNSTRNRSGMWGRLHRLIAVGLIGAGLIGAGAAHAADGAAPALESVDYGEREGGGHTLSLSFSGEIDRPDMFRVEEPARVVLDFPGVANATGQQRMTMGDGPVGVVRFAENPDRMRVVVELAGGSEIALANDAERVTLTMVARPDQPASQGQPVSDWIDAFSEEGSDTYDVVGADEAMNARMQEASPENPLPGREPSHELTGVSIESGSDRSARVVMGLSRPNVDTAIHSEDDRVIVRLHRTEVSDRTVGRINARASATPVRFVDVERGGGLVRVIIQADDRRFRHAAYQSGGELVVELQPDDQEDAATTGDGASDSPEESPDKGGGNQRPVTEREQFTGRPITLKFQDIEVRSVLQLLADFTDLNVIVDGDVDGSITLQMQNVPWDQALAVILRSQDLGSRRNGNVIYVAPREKIQQREKARLEAAQSKQDLAALDNAFIRVNYAKAADMKSILLSEDQNLLSDRASVSVDERTNTLMVKATRENIEKAKELVEKLDIAVQQVAIKARIVIATDDFTKDLGVRFGVEARSGSSGGNTTTFGAGSGTGGFNVNLPSTGPTSSLAIARSVSGEIIELELNAMEAEGKGKIVSSPRVVTTNQSEAVIEQGVEIPYQEASSSGATSVSFKDATLSLGVTPQITPNGKIVLNLDVSKDSVGELFNGVPSIDTRHVSTNIVIDNEETVVLGGIYERTQSDQVSRVPFLADLPGVGGLFRQTRENTEKSELLVFVTPNILGGENAGVVGQDAAQAFNAGADDSR